MWKEDILPRIQNRGMGLTKALIEEDSTAVEDARVKGELRALKWLAELPVKLTEELQRQMRDAEDMPVARPTEFGHPYGPTPEASNSEPAERG